MSNENPFGDLSSEDEQTDADGVESESESAEVSEAESEPDPLQTPAFDFETGIRRNFYARDEAWDDFDELVADAGYVLRKEHGLSDVPKRELFEAALRSFLDGRGADADTVAEYVIETRENSEGG